MIDCTVTVIRDVCDVSMPAKQMSFYATYDDICKVLEQFEAEEHVVYVLTGLFDADTPQVIETYRAINSLSISVDGDANHVPGYLIVGEAHQVSLRKVPQRTGGNKFAVDQSLIPDSLYFQSGGTFADKIIVPGKIGIAHQATVSRKLYGVFARIMAKNFSKVKSYYVGQEAYALWQTGMRLGLSLKASAEIDLKR
jgi:hypothetical protein